MTKSDRMINRIRKLLALANDQQGTPEGDLSMSQAMKLMAEHGLSSGDVKEDETNHTIGRTVIDLSNQRYMPQHRVLVNQIAIALNCSAIGKRGITGKIDQMEVFGRGIDRERVVMLYSVASPSMIASAMKSVPKGSHHIVRRRLSHMVGYAVAINKSLSGHETKVRTDHGDSRAVILADKVNADRALAKMYPSVKNTRGGTISHEDYERGMKEGANFDTGTTSRIGGHRALSS